MAISASALRVLEALEDAQASLSDLSDVRHRRTCLSRRSSDAVGMTDGSGPTGR